MRKNLLFSGITAVSLLIMSGCGSSSNDISSDCHYSNNDFVRESSTSGSITYDCTQDVFGLASGTPMEITGISTEITAVSADRNLTIDSNALDGTEHRIGSDPGNGTFDCVNTYVSELPVTVDNTSVGSVVTEWTKDWAPITAESNCPQSVTDLNPNNYDKVQREYNIDSKEDGTSKITINMYYL